MVALQFDTSDAAVTANIIIAFEHGRSKCRPFLGGRPHIPAPHEWRKNVLLTFNRSPKRAAKLAVRKPYYGGLVDDLAVYRKPGHSS
jgi:hypothetical protein